MERNSRRLTLAPLVPALAELQLLSRSKQISFLATSPVPPLQFVIFRHNRVVAVGAVSGLGRSRWASSW